MDYSTLPIRITYVGENKTDDRSHDEWRVEFSQAATRSFWSTTYRTGLGHRSKPKNTWAVAKPVTPKVRDVLESLLMDASAADQNFADWCSDLGYSDDSIKALNTYKQCCEIATVLRKYLGRETVEAIRTDIDESNAA